MLNNSRYLKEVEASGVSARFAFRNDGWGGVASLCSASSMMEEMIGIWMDNGGDRNS